MNKSRLFLILLFIVGSAFADETTPITDKLQSSLGSDAKSFFTEAYAVANVGVKNELVALGKKILPVEDSTIQRVKKALLEYTRIDQTTFEYNEKYKAKLESPAMENILLKHAVEDLTSKDSKTVIVKGLKSYNKANAEALLTFMELLALEDVNGIENREKQFFDTVRTKLELPAFDREFCKRVSGDHCTISNAVAHPIEL